MKIHRLFPSTALAGLILSPVSAHRFWIIPSSSVLSGDEPWACFDAVVSNDLFYPNHFAPALESHTATFEVLPQ